MAAHERLFGQKPTNSHSLHSRLAEALPKGYAFNLYHVSTPPVKSEALCSAPPGEQPDRTYCESHFLAASVNTGTAAADHHGQVLVFAVEVLIYSTTYSTMLFVSKADSTGYFHLLNLPKGSASPIKRICSIFLGYLVEQRKRRGVQIIVSLFARAQDQYLFPGSVDNVGKHVLDDRGLIRWWCRVLDPLVKGHSKIEVTKETEETTSYGQLLVPGLDQYETMQLLPVGRGYGQSRTGWTIGHPLQELSRHALDIPPRCLIPHFPDDPKARFLDELDEEASGSQGLSRRGQWRSVSTLDQFWEMMAFRQECSAGRMVGFIWVVFPVESRPEALRDGLISSQSSILTGVGESPIDDTSPPASQSSVTPGTSVTASSQVVPNPSLFASQGVGKKTTISGRSRSSDKKKWKKLSGPIVPRQPRFKTENRSYSVDVPSETPYYIWPADSRGQAVLESKGYQRINEILHRLDFSDLSLAKASTSRWISEVQSEATRPRMKHFGVTIHGTAEVLKSNGEEKTSVTKLCAGLVRKKRKAGSTEAAVDPNRVERKASENVPQVNVLGAGMIRKKIKP
ncbi:MAG: hypothetical protein M1818_002351 [Claussenomyces sp. TS43310]|nr:MAG: hypothetical protein M1818_002351 [Claussenomyces sp. TS43310]